MDVTLSGLQQRDVWDGWLGAEIRSHYYADLCWRYQRAQKVVTWLTLTASSGATVTLVAGLPQQHRWIVPVLTLLTAGLSLWGLVAAYQRSGTDCSDLHAEWNRQALDYKTLWGDMYGDAPARLAALQERERLLSKRSNNLPNKAAVMRKWTRHVVSQHATA